MKEIEYFFEWMSPSEVAEDFGVSEEEALRQVEARGMRTRTTKWGDLQVLGEDLKAWYDELCNEQLSMSNEQCSMPRKTGNGKGKRRKRMDLVALEDRSGPDEVVVEGESCYPPLMPEWLRVDSEGARWVTVGRAAEVLGIPESQVLEMIRADRLYSRKVKGSVWVLEYALRYARPLRANDQLPIPVAQMQSLISTYEVMEILDVGRDEIRRLAEQGKLTRIVDSGLSSMDYKRRKDAAGPGRHATPIKWWYRLEEVEMLAESRMKRGPGDNRRNVKWWGDRSTFKQRLQELKDLAKQHGSVPDEYDGEYRWISPKEAAEIMGMSKQRVRKMVDTGLLPAHQEKPGRSGSPLWIYSQHVYSLLNRRTYQEKRAAYLRGLERRSPVEDEAPFCSTRFPYEPLPSVDRRRHSARTLRDYGEFYTTRQVALLMGVGVVRVLELRRTGRLQGYKRPPIYEVIREQGSYPQRRLRTGNQWWFFKKVDVDALLADHSYCVRRRGYERSKGVEE